MKFFAKAGGSLLAVCLMLSGCTTDEIVEQYVRLDETTYSFLCSGNEPQTVKVKASGEWNVEVSASWIEIVEETAEGVVINVTDNDQEGERHGELTFTCGDALEAVNVYQLGNDAMEWRFRWPYDFDLGAVISPNGRYLGGLLFEYMKDGTPLRKVTITDLDTDEMRIVAEVPKSLFGIEAPICITDQGLFFVSDVSEGGVMAFDLAGNYWKPENVAGWEGTPNVEAVSSDGNIWIGYGRDKIGTTGMYYPLVWKNGTPEQLPWPENNYRDEDFKNGIMARGCSHDGSVIYGSTWDDTDCGMLYWKDGKVDWVGSDIRTVERVTIERPSGESYERAIVTGLICSAQRLNCSPNGKYIAGMYCREFVEGGSVQRERYPAFFNTETKTTTVIKDYGEGGGMTATDDGIGFSTIGITGANAGAVVDIDSGMVLGKLEDWIKDNYGITIPGGYIRYVTPSGTMFGRMMMTSAAGTRTTDWYMVPNNQAE